MKIKKINKAIACFLSISACILMTACSDWTKEESMDLDYSRIQDQNADLYAKYLTNLRSYKASKHNVLYAWFDNSVKTAFSESQHIDKVPDSTDYIVLKYPNGLLNSELTQMQQVRSDKGTKVLCAFDYDAIKSSYDVMVADLIQAGTDPTNLPKFVDVLADSVKLTFKLVDQYNYDGIVVGYKGKSVELMSTAEKAEFTTYQNTYFTLITNWNAANKTRMLTFMGLPQNVLDKAILSTFKHIILPTMNVTAPSSLTFQALTSMVENVPTDRFVVMAQTTSLDESDAKTGYWNDKVIATLGTSAWVISSHDGFNVVGMGIYNVNNDYYNLTMRYKNTRMAIQTMNTSVKN